jgi:hypothetical protein
LPGATPITRDETAHDPIGAANDTAIREIAQTHCPDVCAWGIHGAYLGRGGAVRQMLRATQTFTIWS